MLENRQEPGRGLESFIIDKMIGLGCFLCAALFFFAGVAASYVSRILVVLSFLVATMCLCLSFWFIRKE
jgi:Flp pilus assembly protein TadB